MKYGSNMQLTLQIRESEDVSPLPEPITVRLENLSLVFDTGNALRLYGDIPNSVFDKELVSLDCSPPTPIAQMNSFRDSANAHRNTLQSIVSSLNQNSLHMASFA